MLQTALKAARSASQLVRQNFGQKITATIKHGNPQDLVTETDLASEKIIIDIIRAAFPEHGIRAEESGEIKNDSPYLWLIDALDGTTNFVRGLPCFSISIALAKNNETILGVVANPLTQEIFYAEKGSGAFLNDKPIRVSEIAEMSQAFANAEWWSRSSEFKERGIKIFSNLAVAVSKIRYTSGVVWGLTQIARGSFDIHTADTLSLDIAAIALIIEEAGGKVTDEQGQAISPSNSAIQRIVATNGLLHKSVLTLIQEINR